MQVQITTELSPAQEEEWCAFLDRAATAHPEQHPAFAPGWRARYSDVYFAMGRRDGALVAVAMFAAHPHGAFPGHYRDAMPLSGPVCDDAGDMVAFLAALEREAPFSRMGALELTPYWFDDRADALSAALRAAGWEPSEPAIERTTGLCEITAPPDEILAGFSTNARRSLRKAVKLGATMEYITDEARALEVFELILEHGARRFGEEMDIDSYLADFRHVYATANLGMLAVLRHEDRDLGGLICYRSRDTVIYRKFFVDDALTAAPGSIRVAPLMILEAMKWGQAHGCRSWDFDGYAEGLDEDHKYYRAFKYKEAFRPRVAQRIVSHRKVLRPGLIRSSDFADHAKDGLRGLVNPIRDRLRAAG